MLTSSARETLRSVEAVIVDEIHALAATKRGAHLALSLERLEAITEPAAAAHRPVGHAAPARGDRPLPRRLRRRRASRGRSRSSTPACASRSRSRSSSRSRTWATSAQVDRGADAAARPAGRPGAHAASGRRSTRASSSWSWRTARTLIFCNARRLAERLAARLNELAETRGRRRRRTAGELVKAHHGSLAREQRLVIEDQLKRGELRGLVATSQPRARHRHGRGRPRHPGRVAGRGQPRACSASAAPATRSASRAGARSSRSTAATCSRRRSSRGACSTGLIEETRYLRNPLDVLAQQIVAHVRDRASGTVDELAALVRRAAPLRRAHRRRARTTCSTCSPAATRPRSSPSCGRASCGTASTARVRARDGAKRLAVTSGGTIPDRGLFGVFLPDGTRVGELDEEMVYESRPGETFLLGASHVAHRGHHLRAGRRHAGARASRGRCRSGTATGPGRPLELGRALGAFVREIRDAAAGGGAGAAARATTASTRGPPTTSCATSTSRPRPTGVGARRPHDRGRALPRRDRRLAGVRPLAVRRAGARAVGDGDRAPAERALRHGRSR